MISRIITAAAASAMLVGTAQAQGAGSPTGPDRGAAETANTAGTQQSTDSGTTGSMPMEQSGTSTSGTMSTDSSTTGTMSSGAMSSDPAMESGAMSSSTTTGTTSSGTMSSGSMAADPSMSSGSMASGTMPMGAMASGGGMQPVADTAETRRQYPPLSNAGKRSRAANN